MPERAINYSAVWWVLGVIAVAIVAWIIIGAAGVGSTIPGVPNTGTNTTNSSGSGSNTNTNGY